MNKKLLIWLLGAVGVLTFVCSCYNNNRTKEISASEMLYRGKCSSCHNLIGPGQFDSEKWNTYIDKYGKKMTAEEKELLLGYLLGED